jgi:hypothetical protein
MFRINTAQLLHACMPAAVWPSNWLRFCCESTSLFLLHRRFFSFAGAPTDLVLCLPICAPPSLPCFPPTSACSRETDNQDPDADVNMDVTWQGKLHEQQQHSLQHGGLASGSPAATAARALSGLPGGAFNPSALQWGLGAAGLCAPGAADAGSAAAAAASMLSALGPAQVLALLSNPLYFGEWRVVAAWSTCCGDAG